MYTLRCLQLPLARGKRYIHARCRQKDVDREEGTGRNRRETESDREEEAGSKRQGGRGRE
jgi:hypothetical protein